MRNLWTIPRKKNAKRKVATEVPATRLQTLNDGQTTEGGMTSERSAVTRQWPTRTPCKMPRTQEPPRSSRRGRSKQPLSDGSGVNSQETETTAGDGLGTAAWWILAACIIPWALLEGFFYVKGQKTSNSASKDEIATERMAQPSAEPANDGPAEDTAEETAEKTAEEQEETAEEQADEEPAEETVNDESAKESVDESAEESVDEPAEEQADEESTEEPAEETVDEHPDDESDKKNEQQEEAPTVAISKDTDSSEEA